MRSFWIRIFLTFWVIEIFTITAVVTLRSGLEDFSLNPLSERALLSMAFSAEEAYQAGHCTLLNQMSARFEQAYKVSPYLFDETGQALCRGSAPESVQRAAKVSPFARVTHGIEITRSPGSSRNNDGIAAIRLKSDQDVPYTFVVQTVRAPSWLVRYRGELVILTAIFPSGIITALLAKILVRPIGRLRYTARELASGNLKARTTGIRSRVSTGDEVASLVHDFNLMADQIESLVGNQKQLIRDISHELRSPLARLSVALELLREDTNEQSMVHVERIERESARLNRLIGQLLELSRMEAMDRAGVGMQMIHLQDVINEVVENASYEARSRSCSVRAVVEEAVVCGNKELLSSALENVVRNAIRYTMSGTDVTVSLERQECETGGVAKVTVRDFGPGVPEDKIPSLCIPFYRVDPARSDESGGTGVGLAIADRAVRLHGGTLILQNHPQGGFEVSFVLALAGTRTWGEMSPRSALQEAKK